ncbi:MAG: hypothetical protein MJ129_03730 [Clostridia bacterium]|nr:hypothetical protein [Clostridia bacterium]
MDERRRTISSEDSMVGEALLRVSNTLEAQRLTKSLDYQEKLRTRSNIRLILAIICMVLAAGLLIVGVVTLIVLLRYADPVLDTVVPFLKNVLGGVNTMFESLTETVTYLPVLTEQITRLMEDVIKMLDGLSATDIAGMLGYVTDTLGTVLGGLGKVDFAGDINTISGMASDTLSVLAKGTDALSSVAGAALTGDNIKATADAVGTVASSSASIAGSVADALAGFAG